MQNGVKLVFKKDNFLILSVLTEDGHNLPSAQISCSAGEKITGTDMRMGANELFYQLTHQPVEEDTLVPLYRGADDEYGISSSYLAVHEWQKLPAGIEWTDPREILLGKWGLFARQVFNKLGIMNRPALSLEKVYQISEKALNGRSASVTEAIDMVIDEVALLADIRKPWAIDSILRQIDLMRTHPDVIATLKSVVDEIPDLPSKAAFNRAAQARLDAVDGKRVKIRFGIHEDVRATALSIYRKTGKEFGDALRAGTLSQRFPHMRSIAEAEATMKESLQEARSPWPSAGKSMPVDQWPDEQRNAALNQEPLIDEIVETDGTKRDSRGVYLDDSPSASEEYEPGSYDPDRPFMKALDEAFKLASDDDTD